MKLAHDARRHTAVALAASLLLVSLACGLLETPTPIDWSTPTPEGAAAPATATPTASVPAPEAPTAAPPASPAVAEVERIRFAPGGTSATVTGSLPPNGARQYILRALAGQTMTVATTATAGQVRVLVWGADGTTLQGDTVTAPGFEGVLPSTQDYVIALHAGPDRSADYTMVVTIPPR